MRPQKILFLVFLYLFQYSYYTWAADIAVTPPGWDDMGAIIEYLGYEYDQIDEDLLSNYNNIKSYKAIFLNCAATCSSHATAATSEALQTYVDNGGIVYASDWAFIYIENAFPGYINFYPDPRCGDAQVVVVDIIDAGLAEHLNSTTISINYNLGAWVPILSLEAGVKEYVRGPSTSTDFMVQNKPLLASFGYGDGAVIFTTFHNEAGLSEESRELLNYLVFILIQRNLADELARFIRSLGYIVDFQKSDDKLSQGQVSQRISYTLIGDKPADIVFGFHWEKPGTFLITIYDPDGNVYGAQSSNAPIWYTEIPLAEPGRWEYQVTAQYVPIDNYRYFAAVGKRSPAVDTLSDVLIYPNPCIPSKGHSFIAFDLLTGQATIAIFTIAGELVRKLEKTNTSGLCIWDLKNEGHEDVASGIYVYYITNDQGNTKQGKLAVIR